jgi:hypothetical protein
MGRPRFPLQSSRDAVMNRIQVDTALTLRVMISDINPAPSYPE